MKLKTYMKRMSLTEAQVADALGVNPRTVKNWLEPGWTPQRGLRVKLQIWSGGAVQLKDFLT
jgi:transcriptional regulator with XRE-family HTH domain